MISLQNVDSIIRTSLMFFAYIFSITLAGSLQSLVTRWMGDDTADKAGFSEFNPFIHIGLFDLIFFILTEFMIGTPIPIELRSLKTSWRPLRIFLAFGSRCMVYVSLAVLSLVAMGLLCRFGIPVGDMESIVNSISRLRTESSSHVYVLSIFFVLMTFVNTVLAAFSAIRDSVYCFVLYKFEKDASFIEYANPIMVFGVLLLLIFFGQSIINLFAHLVDLIAASITKICGIKL